MVNVLKRRGLWGDAVLLLLGLSGLVVGSYQAFLLTSVVITALLCLSVGVTTERAGMVSLAQVAMAGVGAWVATWLLARQPELGPWPALVAATLVPSAMAVVLALPTLRVRGVNLAIVTLAFSLVVNLFLTRAGFPGAELGFAYERSGWLESDAHLLLLCALLGIAISRALVWMEQRPFGAAWFGIKFSERAVAAFGINVSQAKVSSFAVAAGIAGLAGGLMVLQLGVLSSRNFEPMASLGLFALAVLSHARFLSGALIAAVLTWFTPELLTAVGLAEWKDIGDLIFALGALHALHGRSKAAVPAKAGDLANAGQPLPLAPRLLEPGQPGELALQGLTVAYGATKAVDAVSLTIHRGSVTGLVGPNGAGKSSLVDAVSGFTRATGGVALDGVPIGSMSVSERARLGLRRTFQVGRAIPELTVGQYVRLASRGVPDAATLDSVLEWMGCPGADSSIASLDVGTRRLVEIAAALLSQPRVLLLDEPAAGMSAPESHRLGEIIQRIPRAFGCTVLLIEHDLALIRNVCSELVVLEFGQVIAKGPVEETLALPHVVDAYIGGVAA